MVPRGGAAAQIPLIDPEPPVEWRAPMPDLRFDVAIIGGGIIGTSIAWHLAKRGCRSVAVVEKEVNPGMGSTAKAAGGIRAQFASRINVALSALSIPAFERFTAEVGTEVVFNQAGYLWFTNRPADMAAFEKNVALQRKYGLDVKLLDRAGVSRLAPYVRIDDIVGGTFHQKDGYAPPADFVLGYTKASKSMGVTYLCDCPVTGATVRGGAVVEIKTSQGAVRADRVVIAAGAWSRLVGAMMGVAVPIEPVRRQCLVTNPIREGMKHPIPMTIDFATGVYMHSESGGVLIGLADPSEKPGFDETVNPDFIEKIVQLAMDRVPLLESASIQSSWGGLYEVTPDHHPIIGAVPGLGNVILAAGFSGHGVMHAPATGTLVAEMLLDGKTSLDLAPLRFSRFKEHDLVQETHVI
jgi:sarcosine oxidase subunit beta